MRRQFVRYAFVAAVVLLGAASETRADSFWYGGPFFECCEVVTYYDPCCWPPIHDCCCCPWWPPCPPWPPCDPCPPGHAAVYNGDRGQLVADGEKSFVSIVWGKTLRYARLKPLAFSDPNYDYFVEVAADGTDLPDDPPSKWAVSKCTTTSCGRHAIYFNRDRTGQVRWSRVQSARRYCIEVKPANGEGQPAGGGNYDGGVGPDSKFIPTPPSGQPDEGTETDAAATVDGAKLVPWAFLLRKPSAVRVTAAKPVAEEPEAELKAADATRPGEPGESTAPAVTPAEKLPPDPFREPTPRTGLQRSADSDATRQTRERARDRGDTWIRVLLSSGFARK